MGGVMLFSPPLPKIGIIYYYVDTLAMIESLVHNIYII